MATRLFHVVTKISVAFTLVQSVLSFPDGCKPIGQLHGKNCISSVVLESSGSLHGPSDAYRVNSSELWGKTTLNVKSVHPPVSYTHLTLPTNREV